MYYFKDRAEADLYRDEYYATLGGMKEKISSYIDNCTLVGAEPPEKNQDIDLGSGLIYKQKSEEFYLTLTLNDLPDSFYIPNWRKLRVFLREEYSDTSTNLPNRYRVEELILMEGQYRKKAGGKWGLKLEKTDLSVSRVLFDFYGSPLVTCFSVDSDGADITLRFKELNVDRFKEALELPLYDTSQYNEGLNSIYTLIIKLCHLPRNGIQRYKITDAPSNVNLYVHYCDVYILIRELAKYLTDNAEALRKYGLKTNKDIGTEIKVYIFDNASVKIGEYTSKPSPRYDWQPDNSYGNKVTMEFIEDFLKRVKTYPYGVKYKREKGYFIVSILDFFYMKIYPAA